jgi:hypothetical protein
LTNAGRWCDTFPTRTKRRKEKTMPKKLAEKIERVCYTCGEGVDINGDCINTTIKGITRFAHTDWKACQKAINKPIDFIEKNRLREMV